MRQGCRHQQWIRESWLPRRFWRSWWGDGKGIGGVCWWRAILTMLVCPVVWRHYLYEVLIVALCRDVVSAKSNFQIQPDRQDQVVAHPPLMLLGKHPFFRRTRKLWIIYGCFQIESGARSLIRIILPYLLATLGRPSWNSSPTRTRVRLLGRDLTKCGKENRKISKHLPRAISSFRGRVSNEATGVFLPFVWWLSHHLSCLQWPSSSRSRLCAE